MKYFGTSDEAVTLMKSGQYDVVSASGDATLRMIAAGDVAPVNTDLIPNYADDLGLPQGPRLELRQRPDVRRPARLRRQPADVQHRGGRPRARRAGARSSTTPAHYSGKVTAYDSPIYIADAALYLMKTQPDLGIEDPYALDDDQLAAAVDLLKAQREHVGEYWSDYLKEIQAFSTGDSVIGTTWQVIVNVAQAEKAPVEAILPEEGATGWSDTWMICADTEVPNCAYLWLDHIVSPEANAAVAEWFGEAPANSKACDLTSRGLLRDLPRRRRGLRRADPLLDDADRAVPRRAHRRRRARRTRTGPRPGPRSRAEPRLSCRELLHRHPRLRLGLLLGPPMLWLGVAYLGALAALFITALWTAERVHRQHRADLDARQLPRALQPRRLPHHHDPHPAHRGRR